MKTKIQSYLQIHRIIALVALIALICLSLTTSLSAQDSPASSSSLPAFIQGYKSDEQLERGMIVRFKDGDGSKIETVDSKDADKMHGVVVNPNDAPVTLSNEGTKTFVATAGRYEVLVSTQGGNIAAGEYVTLSAIKGIGMKATENDTHAIGRAVAAFDGQSGVVSSASVKRGSENLPVKIGRVLIDVAVGKNPMLKVDEPNLPSALRKAAQAVAGKDVSPARAYTSVVIFIMSTITAATLMYSGIRSGIISLGRNPLSRKTIVRGILQVVVTGLIIFISGIFGVYLLLRL